MQFPVDYISLVFVAFVAFGPVTASCVSFGDGTERER